MSAHAEYYVPAQSRWPILASAALFLLAFGAGTLINALTAERSGGAGLLILLSGGLLMGLILVGWFSNVIGESRAGLYVITSYSIHYTKLYESATATNR